MSKVLDNGLSRRDALKLLGAAAGASVLANLPSRWSTPQLTAGVLPAHAQTSECWGLIFEVLYVQGTNPFLQYDNGFPDPTPIENPPAEFQHPAAGFKAYWACAPACVWVIVYNPSDDTGGMRFTTQGHPPLVVDLASKSIHWVYVNLATGAMTDGSEEPIGDPSPEGCEPPFA